MYETTSCVSHGFREEFLSVSPFKSMEANDSRGMAILETKSMGGRIYVGDYKT